LQFHIGGRQLGGNGLQKDKKLVMGKLEMPVYYMITYAVVTVQVGVAHTRNMS
jgi:hypothetical protein